MCTSGESLPPTPAPVFHLVKNAGGSKPKAILGAPRAVPSADSEVHKEVYSHGITGLTGQSTSGFTCMPASTVMMHGLIA